MAGPAECGESRHQDPFAVLCGAAPKPSVSSVLRGVIPSRSLPSLVGEAHWYGGGTSQSQADGWAELPAGLIQGRTWL